MVDAGMMTVAVLVLVIVDVEILSKEVQNEEAVD